MRSKAPLALAELTVMLAVFALVSALCLKAFLWADTVSAHQADRDRAMLEVQNAAELMKHHAGDGGAAARIFGGVWDGETWVILYDENWSLIEDMHAYSVRVRGTDSGLPYLGRAEVTAFRGDVPLAKLEVCWQEVSGNG